MIGQLIDAAVWLIAIGAAWDMVRRLTRSAHARAVIARLDALEAQVRETRAAERLNQIEITMRNIQKSPQPARRWGA